MQACSTSSSFAKVSDDCYCGSSSSSLLERLIDDAPDIFQHEVLPKLLVVQILTRFSSSRTVKHATALALLRRVSRKCKAAVEARAGQPNAGFSEGVAALSCSYFHTSVELFEWARANDMPLDWRSGYYAAMEGGGGVEVLAKVRGDGCAWNESAFDWVALTGNLEALKYMHEEECPWHKERFVRDSINAMDHAARSGNVEMIRWLQSMGAEWGENTFPGAAEKGGVAMLEFLWEQLQGGEDIPFDPEDVITHACIGEDVESVKWCVAESRGELRCELSAECLTAAAERSSLDMIKFLREDLRCPWDEDTCESAVLNSLGILQWVRAHGCPWDATTMICAAGFGHMEALKWARVNDAPWNKGVCEEAARCGHFEALMWLVENGCPFDPHEARVAAEESRACMPSPYADEHYVQILSWLDENFAD